MNAGVVVALVIAAVFAVGDWIARARDERRLEYVCKPLALAALAAGAVALHPAPHEHVRRWWFVVALAWSLAGDVWLMLEGDYFVAGLASFLVAHLCYVGGFLAHAPGGLALAAAGVVVAVVVGALGARILRSVDPGSGLRIPVAVYVTVIAVMWACALASGNVAAAAGATLFVASDSMIAWDRFVTRLGWAPVAIMVTYHLGQAGLVVSLLR